MLGLHVVTGDPSSVHHEPDQGTPKSGYLSEYSLWWRCIIIALLYGIVAWSWVPVISLTSDTDAFYAAHLLVLLGLAYAYGYCLSSAARLKTPDEYETPIDYEHVVDINRYLTFALVSSLGVWTGLFILDRLTNESGSFDVAKYQLNVIVALVVALIYALRFKFQNVKGKNLRHELKQLKREVRYIHEQLKVLQSP